MWIGIDVGGTSVKAAAVEAGRVVWTAVSSTYSQAGTQQIVEAIRQAVAGRAGRPQGVGVCVPGLMDREKRMVTLSVNVPGLNGVVLDELVSEALAERITLGAMSSDAVATGMGIWFERRMAGRLLCLALGTGVGAAVLDDGAALKVSGDSPGHIGQVDVSLEGEPVIGPDGGAGSLEGYIGGPALLKRYGPDVAGAIAEWTGNEPPLRALARAIRICHAIYRPQHVVLAGGLGIRLGRVLEPIRTLIERDLSRVARPGWTLSVGDSDFHAATGAAAMAAM
jgi:glucokinase